MFGKICSALMCLLRVVLFLACIILFLDQLSRFWMLWMLGDYFTELKLSTSRSTIIAYISIIALAVMAIVGAHVALHKNPKGLGVFGRCIVIIAILNIVSLSYGKTTNINETTKLIEGTMKDMAHKYQPDLAPGKEPNVQTLSWDVFQTALSCCGLNGPKDWQEWKSYYEKDDSLPSSCCHSILRGGGSPMRSDKCYANDTRVLGHGCKENVGKLVGKTIIFELSKQLILLVMALIAFALAKYHESPANPTCPIADEVPNLQKFNDADV